MPLKLNEDITLINQPVVNEAGIQAIEFRAEDSDRVKQIVHSEWDAITEHFKQDLSQTYFLGYADGPKKPKRDYKALACQLTYTLSDNVLKLNCQAGLEREFAVFLNKLIPDLRIDQIVRLAEIQEQNRKQEADNKRFFDATTLGNGMVIFSIPTPMGMFGGVENNQAIGNLGEIRIIDDWFANQGMPKSAAGKK